MDDNNLNQSLVEMMRSNESNKLVSSDNDNVKDDEPDKIKHVTQEYQQFDKSLIQSQQHKTSLIRPMYSSLTSPLVGCSRSLSNLNKQRLDRRNIKLGPNIHNKLVEKLMRKDSRFIDQLVDWLDEGVGSGFGILSLEDGVQEMLEVVMCDFVVDMCKGACRLASMAQKVANDDLTIDLDRKKTSQDTQKFKSDNSQQRGLQKAVTISDVVYHCEKVAGVPIPNMLLSLHQLSNSDEVLSTTQKFTVDPVKPRLFNLRKNDTVEDSSAALNSTDSPKSSSSAYV